jgi:hypothetical protein
MITNTGKDIIAKYMLGQAAAYASHIAIGCGKKPLGTLDTLPEGEFALKKNLDFEMFRVPIISRGYVTELDTANPVTITGVSNPSGSLIVYTATNNFAPGDIVNITGTNIPDYNIANAVVYSSTSSQFTVQGNASGAYTSGGTAIGRIAKVVLTAELPTEQRYELTEIGLYPSKSNPSASNKDSRMLYTFAETENWEYHGSSSAIGIGSTISTPLYAGVASGTINPNLGVAPAFRATSNNAVFDSALRLSKNERCRFLNSAIYLPGNMSDVLLSSGTMSYRNDAFGSYGTHIHLAGTALNLSQNSPEDEIRLAFSVINKDESFDVVPSKVHILVQFTPEEGTVDTQNYANFQIKLSDSESIYDLDENTMASNRYHIVSSKLNDLVKGSTFSWGAVSLIKIYASVFNSINVIGKELASNVAKLTTQKAHGFTEGSVVTVAGVDATFNGTYKITSVPTATTFTYAKTNGNVTYTSASGTTEGPSSNYFVGLDALRLENVSSLNPLYGLTGYSATRTADSLPIIKNANSSSLVEFRFGLDVL